MAGRADYRRGNFSLDEVQGKRLFFLLDLRIGGEIIRLSSEDIIANAGIDDETGETVYERYYGGLEFDQQIEDPLALLNDSPDQKSISLTLHLWPQWSIPEMLAAGVVFGAGTGSLYLWPEDGDYRIKIVEGSLRDPSWNYKQDPLVIILEEDPAQDRALWPRQTTRKVTKIGGGVDDGTFTQPADSVVGEFYPKIFGSPGSGENEINGSPGLYIDVANDELLIADGWVVSIGSSIKVYDATDEEDTTVTIEAGEDALGQRYSFVTLVSTGTFVADPSHEYWVRWQSLIGSVWGERYGTYADNRDLDEGMRGAGDILIYWLRQSNIIWDEGRINTIRPILNQYRIDTYAMASSNERFSPYDWIQENLVPVLPIAPRIGPGGLYYIVWSYEATRDEAILHLKAGENADAEGAIYSSSIDEVNNTIFINYARDAKENSFSESLIVTGSPDKYIEADGQVVPNLYARRSFEIYQEEKVKEVSLQVIEDPGTVGMVAAWMIRADATQWYTTSYAVVKEDATLLTPGDVITVLDEDRGLYSVLDGENVGRVCIVDTVTISASELWTVSIRIPAADLGAAA